MVGMGAETVVVAEGEEEGPEPPEKEQNLTKTTKTTMTTEAIARKNSLLAGMTAIMTATDTVANPSLDDERRLTIGAHTDEPTEAVASGGVVDWRHRRDYPPEGVVPVRRLGDYPHAEEAGAGAGVVGWRGRATAVQIWSRRTRSHTSGEEEGEAGVLIERNTTGPAGEVGAINSIPKILEAEC